MTPDDMFACIYLDCDADLETVLATVAETVQGSVSRGTVTTSGAVVDVDENDEHDPIAKREFPGGFLYFRYVVEVYPDESLNFDRCFDTTSRLLTSFWSRGYAAVTAADDEDSLPRRGGGKAEDEPWPGR